MPKAVVITSRRPANLPSIHSTTRSGGESSPMAVSGIAASGFASVESRTIRIRAPIASLEVPWTKKQKARRTFLRAGYSCESKAR